MDNLTGRGSFQRAAPLSIRKLAATAVAVMVAASVADSWSNHIVVEIGIMVVFWLGYAVLWLLLAMAAFDLWKARSSNLTCSKAARTLAILAGILVAVHVALIVLVSQAF